MTSKSKSVWPPLVRQTVDVEKPISEYIRDWAEYCPDILALRFYGHDISYGRLNRDIDRFANGLLNLGLEKGDRVALYMQNCPQFVISFFGALRAGGIVVALNPMFKKGELEYEINDAGAEFLVSLDYLYPELLKIKDRVQITRTIVCSLRDYLPDTPCLPLPDEALSEKQIFPNTIDFMDFISDSSTQPVCRVTDVKEDLALLQYTGGTTGLPKGAMISHYNLCYSSLGSVEWYKVRQGDVFMGVTPFFHIMGMQQMLCSPLLSGAQVVLLSRFDVNVTAKAIEHYQCSFWTTAATGLIAFLETPGIEDYDLSSLRNLVTGGTPISSEIQKRIRRLSPAVMIFEGYGLTESVSHGGAATPMHRHKPGYVGVAHLNRIRLVELKDGKTQVPRGKEGEIIIKGPTVMKGYWRQPGETRETIRDGWLYTGDIGVFDEEGYLKIAGRKKELIKCSGFSVFPSEVENLLFKNPAVLEAAVIGVPDEYRGESPKAFIVLRPEFTGKETPETILAWCKENMSAYKRPREVEFVENLPKSAAGKLLRKVLVERESIGKGGD